MKTYKLIKKYPGSFELGHLAVLDISVKYYNLGTTTRSLDYIENNPEHWQHVCHKCHENVNTCKTFGCKKDYEIVSLEYNNHLYFKGAFHNNENCYYIKPDSLIDGVILQSTFDNNKLPNVKIHSVKRLSDGEI